MNIALKVSSIVDEPNTAEIGAQIVENLPAYVQESPTEAGQLRTVLQNAYSDEKLTVAIDRHEQSYHGTRWTDAAGLTRHVYEDWDEDKEWNDTWDYPATVVTLAAGSASYKMTYTDQFIHADGPNGSREQFIEDRRPYDLLSGLDQAAEVSLEIDSSLI